MKYYWLRDRFNAALANARRLAEGGAIDQSEVADEYLHGLKPFRT